MRLVQTCCILTFALGTTARAAGPYPLPNTSEYVELHNDGAHYPATGVPIRLSPSTGEDGHYAGVRFDREGEWILQGFDYWVPNTNENGLNCSVWSGREVDIYLVNGDTPPNVGIPDRSFTVPGLRSAPIGAILFEVDVEPPLSVPAGSSVVLAFQLDILGFSEKECILMGSAERFGRGETDFWSNAANQPYAWTGLNTFDIYWKPLVSLYGHTPPY